MKLTCHILQVTVSQMRNINIQCKFRSRFRRYLALFSCVKQSIFHMSKQEVENIF